jgi:hypothetical protein
MNPMLMQMLQQYYRQQQMGQPGLPPQGMGQFRSLGQMANPYMGMGGGYGGMGGYGGVRAVAPQENTIQGALAPQSPWSRQMNQIIGAGAGGPLPPPDTTDNSASLAAARAAGFNGGGPGVWSGGPSGITPVAPQENTIQGAYGMPRMAMGPGLMAGRRRGWY